MIRPFQTRALPKSVLLLPWLHFFSLVSVFMVMSLTLAVHSDLGAAISPGESPGFAWIRDHIDLCLGLLLLGRCLVCAAQYSMVRYATSRSGRMLQTAVSIEVIGLAALALIGFKGDADLLSTASTPYVILILLQAVLALNLSGFFKSLQLKTPQLPSQRSIWTLMAWLFLLGGVVAYLEPSWRRLADQVVLDSNWEHSVWMILPAWISGAINLWIGFGLLGVLSIFWGLVKRFNTGDVVSGATVFLAHVYILALLSAALLVALFHAIAWQIAALDLEATGIQLFFIVSVTGGALLAVMTRRLAQCFPQIQDTPTGTMVSLTLGAVLILPLAWLMTSRRFARANLRLLATVILAASILTGYLVLFGNIFDPWFTTFSYLKGAGLKLCCTVAAGSAVYLFWGRPQIVLAGRRRGLQRIVLSVLAVFIGLGPFWVLLKFPEVKATVLQFNELSRVDAAFAGQAFKILGLGKRVRLGQHPPPNGLPDPWPLPWHLSKTHASLLPADFNLLVIVVDALRGDALSSAGYGRNTTPLLDRWAREEAISFRRAYSQGGGSFAAFPFLVGGRSPFALYESQIYRKNLYYKLARAEKMSHFWVTGRFGPRAIFPPDIPVNTLDIDRPAIDYRTPTADEAFESVREAIRAMPDQERFLCFLHLMDVHNDLWKKPGGIDFGDRPRDIYDNNLSYLDRAFERFVRWLKEEAIYDRTVILFTADHGEQFWEHGASLHGHTVYEEDIRVPLILLTHNVVKRFEQVPVLSADMAPTIADLAGYSVDPPYDDPHMGISLRPLIMGDESERFSKRDVAGRASFKRRYFIYRDWTWKLVFMAELDVLQLFNVAQDPLERQNLLQEEPALAAGLERALLEYLEKVEGRSYLPIMGNCDQ